MNSDDAIKRLVAQETKEHEENKKKFGTNGGIVCDVNRGPCSCGAWH